MKDKAQWKDDGKCLYMELAEWLYLIIQKAPGHTGQHAYWIENSESEEYEIGFAPTIEEAKEKAEQIAIDLAERILTSLKGNK